MPWFTVDCGLHRHPKMAALPSDSARYGWIVVIAEAKLQRRPGTFSSTTHFREVMGRFGKFAGAYLEAGLLDRQEDGSLAVHNWSQYQRDPAGRQALVRHTEVTPDSQESHESVTEKSRLARASRAVAVPVDVSSDVEGGVGGDEPEGEALTFLAQHGCFVRPGNGFHQKLVLLVERHGIGVVLRQLNLLARAGVPDGDVKGFVFGAEDALRVRVDLKAMAAEDRAKVEAESFDRRVEATRHNLVKLGHVDLEDATAHITKPVT